jgi:hypothetical protein
MGDCIRRVDNLGDSLRVVSGTATEFADSLKTDVLTYNHPELFTDITGQSTIRIGTGEQIGNGTEYEIHGANAIYFEANIVTRDLTSAEQEWCDETIRYSGDSMPDDVIEFTIPHPDELRHAIREQNLDAFEELGAVIRTAESRHTVLTELQQTLEESKLLTTKLSSGKGQLIDLPPEWDPEVDDSDRDALYGLALSREDSHLVDFRSVAGFDYNSFFAARARSLGVTEPNLKYSDLIALSVAGVPDWDYCRLCGAVAPPNQFLYVEYNATGHDKAFRVCDDCADTHTGRMFTEDAVSIARDERAVDLGGQRTVHGSY